MSTPNYAFKPIAEQALRSNQNIVPQRLNAALARMSRYRHVPLVLLGITYLVMFLSGNAPTFLMVNRWVVPATGVSWSVYLALWFLLSALAAWAPRARILSLVGMGPMLLVHMFKVLLYARLIMYNNFVELTASGWIIAVLIGTLCLMWFVMRSMDASLTLVCALFGAAFLSSYPFVESSFIELTRAL